MTFSLWHNKRAFARSVLSAQSQSVSNGTIIGENLFFTDSFLNVFPNNIRLQECTLSRNFTW